jgi:hypothetical protein
LEKLKSNMKPTHYESGRNQANCWKLMNGTLIDSS